jgi:hypothetical protein
MISENIKASPRTLEVVGKRKRVMNTATKYPRTQNFVFFIIALHRRIIANLLYTEYVLSIQRCSL